MKKTALESHQIYEKKQIKPAMLKMSTRKHKYTLEGNNIKKKNPNAFRFLLQFI